MLAAIPLIPATGGGSLFAVAAFSGGLATAGTVSGVSGMAIAAMCVAIGGIVVIGIFTDFEEVEINGIFKLKRKVKASK
jgi:4-hydroxybenzoate polyprenyltransferase